MTTTTRVAAFIAAETTHSDARRKWNALPTPEARGASGIVWEALDADLRIAARELIIDAADRHHIEERAVVYLKLDVDGWVIDTPTRWDDALAGYDDGALNEACPDGDDPHDQDECDALVRAACTIDIPTARQLRTLISDYIGDPS